MFLPTSLIIHECKQRNQTVKSILKFHKDLFHTYTKFNLKSPGQINFYFQHMSWLSFLLTFRQQASIVYCDTSVVYCDTSVVYFDSSVVYCDTSVVHCDLSVLYCDTSVVYCDTYVV